MNIEAQKYKIWVNKAWIVWMKPDEFKSFKFSKVSVYILLQDPGSDMIKSYLDQLLAGTLHHQVVIVTKKDKAVLGYFVATLSFDPGSRRDGP